MIVLIYFITHVKYTKSAQVSYIFMFILALAFSTDTIKLSHQYIYILSEVALDETNISGCLRMHF